MSNDTPYCGVDKETIDNASPVFVEGRKDAFSFYINERFAIQDLKDSGAPAPWTDNPTLRDFRFTCVCRKHDRISRWYIANIAERTDLDFETKFYNTLLFRIFNKTETAEAINQPFTMDQMPTLRSRFDAAKASGYTSHFGSAYLTCGQKKAWDRDSSDMSHRMVDMLEWTHKHGYAEKVANAKDQKECCDIIEGIRGFGEFLAYQVFVDLSYIPEFQFTDEEFTVSGPGCRRGINCLFEDRDGMTEEECIFWIRDNQEKFGLSRHVTVMDIENCFCEFSKFIGRQLNPKKRMRRYG